MCINVLRRWGNLCSLMSLNGLKIIKDIFCVCHVWYTSNETFPFKRSVTDTYHHGLQQFLAGLKDYTSTWNNSVKCWFSITLNILGLWLDNARFFFCVDFFLFCFIFSKIFHFIDEKVSLRNSRSFKKSHSDWSQLTRINDIQKM